MLYDAKRWDRPGKLDFADFTDWLGLQDGGRTFDFTDLRRCAISQWFRARNCRFVVLRSLWLGRKGTVWNRVIRSGYTFGQIHATAIATVSR